MIKPQISNPHLSVDPDSGPEPVGGQHFPKPGEKFKVRYLTHSPEEEYQVREGQTEQLDPEFHAMLCGGWFGTATCTLRGVLIKNGELVGHANRDRGIRYHRPNSIMCNQLADGDQLVRYTFNPASPGVIHLHTPRGEYIESLPAVNRPRALDNEALAAQKKLHEAQISHAARTLQVLHQSESTEAVDQLSRNAAEMDRVATQLSLPAEQRPQPASDTPHSRMREQTEHLEAQRTRLQDIEDEADADLELHRSLQPAEPTPVAAVYDPTDDL